MGENVPVIMLVDGAVCETVAFLPTLFDDVQKGTLVRLVCHS